MATKLLKPVKREIRIGTIPYIVTLENDLSLSFREKGRKTTFSATLASCYNLAMISTILKEYNNRLTTYNTRKKNGVKYLKKPRKPFIQKAFNPIYSQVI